MQVLRLGREYLGLDAPVRSVARTRGRVRLLTWLAVFNTALLIGSVASFDWLTAKVRGAADGSGGDVLASRHGLGLWWYQEQLLQTNVFTGKEEYRFCYTVSDHTVGTLNEINTLQGAPTADTRRIPTTAGLAVAAAVLSGVAAGGLALLAAGVAASPRRRALYWAVPAASLLAAILAFAALLVWSGSGVKAAACEFFAGASALLPGQRSTCDWGAGFNAAGVVVATLLLHGGLALWLLAGDVTALLNGSATSAPPAAGRPAAPAKEGSALLPAREAEHSSRSGSTGEGGSAGLGGLALGTAP